VAMFVVVNKAYRAGVIQVFAQNLGNYKNDGGVYTHKLASQPLSVGNGTRTYNGSWVTEKIAIPDTYPQMVSGGSNPALAFGAYWKVLYRLGSDSTDVTVWSLSVDGSAVHLVNP